jgi:NADPH-dependent 2,4-dienoyl-CoA reductase/sulfur reductase-like enzyme
MTTSLRHAEISRRHAEVLVVGAGPAGMAAATAAATHGTKVIVLDDNPTAGGQIWRQGIAAAEEPPGPSEPRRVKDTVQSKTRTAFINSGAEMLAGRRVVNAPQPGLLTTIMDTPLGALQETFAWDRLILATGARERFLPFPGWTLPGVFGACGLQALVKGGYSVRGKRIVVAGTGPLLLAVAAYLQHAGAQVVCIAEQAAFGHLLPFAAGLGSHPSKLLEGIRYRAALASVPYRIGWWPLAVEKVGSHLAVKLTNGTHILSETCDALACGFHLVPNTELAELLGCTLNADAVAVDAQQQTSVPNVFCVGEPTGIAGLDAALVQGEIAGLVAAGQQHKATAHYQRRAKEQAFGQRMSTAFQLRPELRSLCAPDTIVCRCEDVSFARLEGHTSWTEAKLQTRCGMGPCQGRVCGPAIQTLFGWRPTSVRPPIFPMPVSAFGTNDTQSVEDTPIYQETQ